MNFRNLDKVIAVMRRADVSGLFDPKYTQVDGPLGRCVCRTEEELDEHRATANLEGFIAISPEWNGDDRNSISRISGEVIRENLHSEKAIADWLDCSRLLAHWLIVDSDGYPTHPLYGVSERDITPQIIIGELLYLKKVGEIKYINSKSWK